MLDAFAYYGNFRESTPRERTCFLILVKSNIENNIYGILKLMSKEKIYMYGFSLVHISSTCILFIDSNRSLLVILQKYCLSTINYKNNFGL